MSHEHLHIPNTADELLADIDAAHEQQDIEEQKVHEEATQLLGAEQDFMTARGRVRLLADLIYKNPDGNFNVAIPLQNLRTDKDRPKDHDARLRAMAVNEQVLNTLYEESGVDMRKREVHDAAISGHPMREIAYPTDRGYVFIESQGFDYGDDPMTAIPTGLSVEVYTLRDGQPVGGIDLTPPPAVNTAKI